MTVSEIDAAIAALERALASGTETVRFADRTVTYRSSDSIKSDIEYFQRRRAIATGERRSIMPSLARFQ